MVDRSDEAGDPACWAHLLEDEPAAGAWVIRGGERNRLVDTFVSESIIGVGYPSIPDGRTLADGELEDLLVQRGKSGAVTLHARMFRAFVHEMTAGDTVLLPDTPRRELVVGQVTGPYRFHPELPAEQYRHRRTVEWLDHVPFEALPPAARHLHRQQQTLTRRDDPALSQLLLGYRPS